MVSKTTSPYIAVLLAAAMLLPLMAGAQSAERPVRDGAGAGAGKSFCENVGEMEAKVLERIESADKNGRDGATDRKSEREAKKAERLAGLEAKRAEANEKRAALYEKLEARINTAEGNVALDEFRATSERLVAERKAANDAAIASFEAAVEDLRGDVDATRGDFKEELLLKVRSAFAQAELECDNADDREEEMEAGQKLRTELAEIKNDFKGERSNRALSGELEEARAERKAAHEAANAAFKAGMEEAKAALRAALSA